MGDDETRLQAERNARRHAEHRLAQVAAIEAVLDDANAGHSLDAVLQALVDKLREVVAADTATILLTDQTGTQLVRRSSSGIEGRLVEPVRVPLGRGIAGRVAASKQPLVLADISEHEVVSETLRNSVTSLAAAPMITAGRVVGVVHVASVQRRVFTRHDVLLLRLVADRAASSIAHARGAIHERQSEQANLVADAAVALSQSLDLETILRTVLDVVIPSVGDFGFLDVVRDDGQVRRIARAHQDPRRQALLDGTSWVRSTRKDINLCALSSGGAVLHRRIDDAWLQEVAASAEHLELLRSLAFESMLTVPLVARKKIRGALTLFRASSHPPHDEQSLQLAQAVASPAALAIDNAQLYEAAQQAARRKDEFFAVLGHELRNPLAPIVTALELVRQKAPAELERELEIIGRQVDHLVRLVDDLLDVTRITRGKLELHPKSVEIAEVAAQAVEQAAPLLERRGHTFVQSVDKTGLRSRVDPHRMAQVLSNLLANAANYTPKGGTVSLVAGREGDEIVISVEDDGVGIEPDRLATLFDPFSQGPQGIDRAAGGLGLGLAIARSLVQLHHGSLSAQSKGPGEGSRFTVRIPRITTGLEIPAMTDQTQPTSDRPMRILLVDDNRDAAQMLRDLLEIQGHDVRTAHDGPTALRVASDFSPEVALLDIGLPVMDGYELAARLRRNLDPAPRLIAVSGYGNERDRKRSAEAGFERHLVKPVSLGDLQAALVG